MVEYFLDGAIDEGEIDGATYTVCRLYGDDAEMTRIIGNGLYVGYRARREKCLKFDALATQILAALPDDRRGALLWEGVISVPREISRLVPVLAGWAVTDAVEGGCMLPHRKHDRINKRTRQIPKGLWRHLCAPTFIRRYTKNCTCAIFRRERAKFTMGRITAMCGQRYVRQDTEIRDMMVRQMQEMRTESYMGRMDEFFMGRAERTGIIAPFLRIQRNKLKQSKKVLKRAAKFAVGAIGHEAVSALARGEPVRLLGQTVQMEVQSRGMLAHPGHGGLSIAVLDLESKRLADLCVYYQDTPALDQVAALSLQLQAGLEQEIVADANIIRADDFMLAHPVFAGHREKTEVFRGRPEIVLTAEDGRFLSGYEETRQRERLYWAATGPRWVEAATVFVAGAKGAKVILPMVTSMTYPANRLLNISEVDAHAANAIAAAA